MDVACLMYTWSYPFFNNRIHSHRRFFVIVSWILSTNMNIRSCVKITTDHEYTPNPYRLFIAGNEVAGDKIKKTSTYL